MSGLISEIFTSFTTVITGLASGIKEAFTAILYADGGTGAFSPLVLFLLTFGGLALAMGLFWKLFGLIRGRTKA